MNIKNYNKEKILQLKNEGFNAYQISKLLNCAKSVAYYHYNNAYKERYISYNKNYRSKLPKINSTIKGFKSKILRSKVSNFQKTILNPLDRFNWKQIIDKFGFKTTCYLTGKDIDLRNSEDYHLDHIIPRSRGGSDSFENLGILHPSINQMKHNLLNEELIIFCKEILENNNYKVEKIIN